MNLKLKVAFLSLTLILVSVILLGVFEYQIRTVQRRNLSVSKHKIKVDAFKSFLQKREKTLVKKNFQLV